MIEKNAFGYSIPEVCEVVYLILVCFPESFVSSRVIFNKDIYKSYPIFSSLTSFTFKKLGLTVKSPFSSLHNELGATRKIILRIYKYFLP